MTTIGALLLALLAAGASTPSTPSCSPVTASCLASLSMEPRGPEMEVSDPRYLEIVGRGLTVVPELSALLADDTPTRQNVPLFGGEWAVGDIAMSALSDIISQIPWLTFIPADSRKSEEQCGFCVYWQHVRVCQRNRAALSTEFQTWYSLHAADLVWVPNANVLTGGSYAISHQTHAS